MELINNRLIGGYDSITYATGDANVILKGAWRYYLYFLLQAWMKTPPRFMGRQHAFGYAVSKNRMLGTTGRRTDQVLSLDDPARTFAESKPAMLILLGAMNDATQINSGAWVGGSVALSVTNRQTIMDMYRAAVPTGIIIDCSCTPNRNAGADAIIDQINAAQLVANDLRSDQAYIIECDLNARFKANPTWDVDWMNDDTHPNDAGQEEIALEMFSDISSNITMPDRFLSEPRKVLFNKKWSLRLTTEGTPPILGTSDMINTAIPWAMNMKVDLSRQRNGENGMFCFKNDQSTPFIFITFSNKNGRGFEFGSNSNFNRFFVNVLIHPAFAGKIYKGGHDLGVIYRGGGRTSSDNYDFILDGIPMRLATAGTGLGVTTDQNALGALMGGGADPAIMDICDLALWNHATAMTVEQMVQWQLYGISPSGITRVRWFEFQQEAGAGSAIIDSMGIENGTIGTAEWVERGISKNRAILTTPRVLAEARAAL